MGSQHTPADFDEAGWIEEQILRYGPVVGGGALRSLLGFRTAAALQKAKLQGQIGIAIFTLPGRQGVFAVTQEACRWVMTQRRAASMDEAEDARSSGKEAS